MWDTYTWNSLMTTVSALETNLRKIDNCNIHIGTNNDDLDALVLERVRLLQDRDKYIQMLAEPKEVPE